MTATEVLQKLESVGTAQNRKVYRRHGVGEKMFGVSFANLDKLRKQIQVDHELAQQLWASGNHDARVLAAMVADPAAMTRRQLDAWVKDLDNYVVTDAFSGLAAKTSVAREKADQWCKSKAEWTSSAGWNIVCHLAMKDEELPDAYFKERLATIEKGVHRAANRTRYAMNNALIAIGIYRSSLTQAAIAAAGRIGKVEVDHGETSCKTPDAVPYIEKALQRKKAR